MEDNNRDLDRTLEIIEVINREQEDDEKNHINSQDSNAKKSKRKRILSYIAIAVIS